MKLLVNNLCHYWRVWWLTAKTTAQIAFVNRANNLLFVLGKCLRLLISMVFLFSLQRHHITVAGYTSDQIIVFFLTYNLMDVVAQIFYRGVYVFSQKIRTGEFDFYLSRPVNPLFRALTGQPDINDVVFAIPTLILSAWLLRTLDLQLTVISVGLYLVLLLNGFLIATGFHILVLVAGILTTEVDNIIWMYRDLSRMGQFPVSMYQEPLRTVLFFMVPVGLMVTVPAQVLLNTPPSLGIVMTCVLGISFFGITLLAWRLALRHYTSASS